MEQNARKATLKNKANMFKTAIVCGLFALSTFVQGMNSSSRDQKTGDSVNGGGGTGIGPPFPRRRVGVVVVVIMPPHN